MDNNIVHTHIVLKDWILEHRPQPGSPARFHSYEFLLFGVLGFPDSYANALSPEDINVLSPEEIREIICGGIELISDVLLEDDIAVQPEAVEGERRGIRIMNLS